MTAGGEVDQLVPNSLQEQGPRPSGLALRTWPVRTMRGVPSVQRAPGPGCGSRDRVNGCSELAIAGDAQAGARRQTG